MTIQWWKHETIRFECQPDCFKCCSKPGVVYMDTKDIRKAAEHLKLTVSRFKGEFFKLEAGLWLIEVEEERPCPFLVEEGCAIHPAKPTQCRSYPFWRENMETRNYWLLTSVFCPGINKGPEISNSSIGEYLEESGS